MVKGKRDQLARPPKELRDAVARKEWKRAVEVLSDIDLLGNADRTNLIGYCNAYSHYIESMQAHDADEELRWGKEMRDFEKLVFLTPDARLKAAAQKTAEKKDEIEQMFGVI
jgi:phage terminase small subunit